MIYPRECAHRDRPHCADMWDATRGSLIYEYIGEVVQERTFRKRMQQYAEEGIKHFYFMMLQKEEVSPPSSLFEKHKLISCDLVHRRDEEGRHRAIRQSLV